MTDPITSMLISKGANLSEEMLKDLLGFKKESMNDRINEINKKIDSIVVSSYEEALNNILAENYYQAELDLNRAIVRNKFDLNARILYISLLRLRGKYMPALVQSFILMDCFGFRKDLVLESVFDEYVKRFFEFKVPLRKPITIENDMYPKTVWCSLNGIVCSWGEEKETIEGYSWNGEKLFSGSQNSFFYKKKRLAIVTNNYAVLEEDANSYEVYDLSKKSELVIKLKRNDFAALFNSPIENHSLINRCRTDGAEISFAGVTIQKGIFSRDEKCYYPDIWGGIGLESSRRVQGGELKLFPSQ